MLPTSDVPLAALPVVLAVMRPAGGLLVFALFGAAIIGVPLWLRHRKHQRKEESLDRLLQRASGWVRTDAPCSLTVANLAGQTNATPRGDRRHGLRYGIEGPLPLRIGGQLVTCRCAFFQWWYEDRRSSGGKHHQTRYVELTETVAIVRLPVLVSRPIRLRPESLLGRFGITRGGDQVESSEFNRRFRVEGSDRTLTVQLLDAQLQQHLLERLLGRSLELSYELLILGGSPNHRDGSLEGAIGEYPAVRQDLEALVARIPAQFWRAVEADRAGRADRSDHHDRASDTGRTGHTDRAGHTERLDPATGTPHDAGAAAPAPPTIDEADPWSR